MSQSVRDERVGANVRQFIKNFEPFLKSEITHSLNCDHMSEQLILKGVKPLIECTDYMSERFRWLR